jgi:hypothetical protein
MIDMIEAPEAQTDITTLPPADRATLALNSTKTEAARVLAELQAEILDQLARIKAQLAEELDRQAAELEARKAEVEEAAQVLADDPREALGQIMPGSMAAYAAFAAALAAPVIAEPVIAAVPATAHQPEPINASPGEAPSAISLINVIATQHGVEPAIAISWLAQRADEFKHLNQLAKVMP